MRSLVEHVFAGQKRCIGPFIHTAAANAASVTQFDARDVLSAIGRRRDLGGRSRSAGPCGFSSAGAKATTTVRSPMN